MQRGSIYFDVASALYVIDCIEVVEVYWETPLEICYSIVVISNIERDNIGDLCVVEVVRLIECYL